VGAGVATVPEHQAEAVIYGNFYLGRKHRKLSRRDHTRVCRTIKFGNKALLAFRDVPRAGVSRDAQAHVPKECR
jgi:hypothetical protein